MHSSFAINHIKSTKLHRRDKTRSVNAIGSTSARRAILSWWDYLRQSRDLLKPKELTALPALVPPHPLTHSQTHLFDQQPDGFRPSLCGPLHKGSSFQQLFPAAPFPMLCVFNWTRADDMRVGMLLLFFLFMMNISTSFTITVHSARQVRQAFLPNLILDEYPFFIYLFILMLISASAEFILVRFK